LRERCEQLTAAILQISKLTGTSRKTRFFRPFRSCPEFDRSVPGLALEDPAKVLFVIESAAITDLLDA
jgi:hypothetical protein